MVLLDFTGDSPQRPGVGTVLDFRLGLHHFGEAAETGVPLLELFGEVDQHFDRIQKDADIQRIDRQFGSRQRPLRHEIAAGNQNRNIEQPLKEAVPGMEHPHQLIAADLGGQEPAVAVGELLAFDLLIRK